MATSPLIFPSLSRQPSMDTTKTIEDDTIRDQAEAGYVSTRPRFTRTRRSWKANVRNLFAEDMRALDIFAMNYAKRGANAFLYPNLLENWSFEFPAIAAEDLVFGWNVSAAAPQIAVGISSVAADGVQAVSFSTIAAQTLAAATTVAARLSADNTIPCTPGEVYVFAASVNAILGTLASGVLTAVAQFQSFDVNGNPLSNYTAGPATLGGGWQNYQAQYTVPAGAASFQVSLAVVLTSGGSLITFDGSTSVTWDTVGCALLTPLTPYGRMIGSASLGCFVRLTSLPETSDVGMGDGVKRYGAHFEVTEV